MSGEESTRHWCANCYPKNNNNPSPDNPSSNPITPSAPSVSVPLNNNPSSPTSNNQSNIKCCNCKKYFNYGDNTHYFPQKPDKKWCDACDHEAQILFPAIQQIIQGQEVNIDNLNISFQNKQVLKIAARIIKGQKVDVDDMIGIDEEDKQELKELQRLVQSGQIPTSTNNPSNPPKKKDRNVTDSPTFWIVFWITFLVVLLILLVPYYIWKQKKIKEMKKAGKKIPWWY